MTYSREEYANVHKSYKLQNVNLRRQKMKLAPIVKSEYHCVLCGSHNDPFATSDNDKLARLMERNVCDYCAQRGKGRADHE